MRALGLVAAPMPTAAERWQLMARRGVAVARARGATLLGRASSWYAASVATTAARARNALERMLDAARRTRPRMAPAPDRPGPATAGPPAPKLPRLAPLVARIAGAVPPHGALPAFLWSRLRPAVMLVAAMALVTAALALVDWPPPARDGPDAPATLATPAAEPAVVRAGDPPPLRLRTASAPAGGRPGWRVLTGVAPMLAIAGRPERGAIALPALEAETHAGPEQRHEDRLVAREGTGLPRFLLIAERGGQPVPAEPFVLFARRLAEDGGSVLRVTSPVPLASKFAGLLASEILITDGVRERRCLGFLTQDGAPIPLSGYLCSGGEVAPEPRQLTCLLERVVSLRAARDREVAAAYAAAERRRRPCDRP